MKYLFLILSLIFVACKNEEISISEGSTDSTTLQEKMDNIDVSSYAGLEDVFSNTKDIKGNGKPVLLVFGQTGCYYCEKLKQDIKNDISLRKYIKDNFYSYYVNISYRKNHFVEFLNENLSTDALASKFNISSTPSIFLIDGDNTLTLRVAGYPGINTFNNMLKFMLNGDYKNLDSVNERMQAFSKFQGNL